MQGSTSSRSGGRTSVEIPRLYEEARQSIDIVQRDRATLDVSKKPNKALVKKARKKAIEIEEHKLSTAVVVSMYTSNFNEQTPQKSHVCIMLCKHNDEYKS